MASKPRYWLMKSEPAVYSIADLERDRTTPWEGIRNYQARNYLRDEVRVGDEVLFYHSSCPHPGVVGRARVCRAAYPDASAFDPAGPYFDSRSTPEKPVWFAVDIAFVARLAVPITLIRMRQEPELAGMLVLRRGMRLSVQPVEPRHFRRTLALAADS